MFRCTNELTFRSEQAKLNLSLFDPARRVISQGSRECFSEPRDGVRNLTNANRAIADDESGGARTSAISCEPNGKNPAIAKARHRGVLVKFVREREDQMQPGGRSADRQVGNFGGQPTYQEITPFPIDLALSAQMTVVVATVDE